MGAARPTIRNIATRVRRNYVVRNVVGALSVMLEDRTTLISFIGLLAIIVLGIIGPYIAPYPPDKFMIDPQTGELLISEPPSLAHPLGTNTTGYDILSRLLIGARATITIGVMGGTMIISIGMLIGVTAGYVGGWVDEVLMRFTDMVYGLPLLPIAIVIIGFFGIGFYTTIFVIGMLLWRGAARVIRAQVMQIKERPYIRSAKATGASDIRIIVKHILPNVGTMAVLFFALGVGFSIVIQAGLAFLGIADAGVPSWGIILRNAFSSGNTSLWWWSLPPGILIALTVSLTFLFGRGYERVAGQVEQDILVQGG